MKTRLLFALITALSCTACIIPCGTRYASVSVGGGGGPVGYGGYHGSSHCGPGQH